MAYESQNFNGDDDTTMGDVVPLNHSQPTPRPRPPVQYSNLTDLINTIKSGEIDPSPELVAHMEEQIALFSNPKHLSSQLVDRICAKTAQYSTELHEHIFQLYHTLEHAHRITNSALDRQEQPPYPLLMHDREQYQKWQHQFSLLLNCLIELCHRYGDLDRRDEQGDPPLRYIIHSLRYLEGFLLEQAPTLLYDGIPPRPQQMQRLKRYANETFGLLNLMVDKLQGQVRDRLPKVQGIRDDLDLQLLD